MLLKRVAYEKEIHVGEGSSSNIRSSVVMILRRGVNEEGGRARAPKA